MNTDGTVKASTKITAAQADAIGDLDGEGVEDLAGGAQVDDTDSGNNVAIINITQSWYEKAGPGLFATENITTVVDSRS